jgi:hypothetical protein
MADSITIQEQQWPANSPEGTPSSTHQHHYVPPASPMRLAALRRASSRNPTIAEPRTKTMTTQSSTSNAENDQLATILSRAPGAEPGIDARKASAQRAYSHIHEDCEIEVIDYSSENIKFRQFHNDSFLEFLESNESVRRTDTKVRWINIGVSPIYPSNTRASYSRNLIHLLGNIMGHYECPCLKIPITSTVG